MTDMLLRSELPQDVQDVLETILAKDPSWLSEPDVTFLRARASYLTSEEKRIFAEVLGDQAEASKSKSQAKREAVQKGDQPEA